MVNVTASYSPKHFLFKVIIRPLPCLQQDSVLLTGPEVYPKIYHSAPCPAVLIFKGV